MKIRVMVVVFLFLFPVAVYSGAQNIIVEAESYVGEGGGAGVLGTTKGRIESSGDTCILAWNNKGHYVEWDLVVPADGDFKVVLRYAHSRKWSTVRDMTIDGKYPASAFNRILLVKTGGLSRDENNWNNLVVTGSDKKPSVIHLSKGIHRIRMTNLGGEFNDDGQSNFDLIGFIAKDADPSVVGKQCILPKDDYQISVKKGGLRYRDPVFEKTDVKRNVVFSDHPMNEKKELVDLTLDIFQPSGDRETRRPAVLLIHGGGFRSGAKEEMEDLCQEYSHRGFVAITMNYRMRAKPQDNQKATVNDALRDSIKALSWIIHNGEDYRINTSKVFIGGESAGGMLALLMTYGCTVDENPFAEFIAGVLDLYGGFPSITFDKKNPLLIIHADTDSVVPYATSVSLSKKAENESLPYEFFTMKNGNHTYNNQFYGEVVSKTSEFMYKTLSAQKRN